MPTNLTGFQQEINELGLKGLIRLIKWVGLKLTYIVLYPRLDMIQSFTLRESELPPLQYRRNGSHAVRVVILEALRNTR
jgi:hypothetical protein